MTTPTPKPGEMCVVWTKYGMTALGWWSGPDGVWAFQHSCVIYKPEEVTHYVPLSDCRAAPVMREALEKIRRGKAHEDNDHPLGEYASMAIRFHNIAREALAACNEAPQ